MVDWQQAIIDAFNQGKTIQFQNVGEKWHDFERQNQLDRPNVNYGYKEQWRIKPYETERKEILEKSDSGHISLDMVERMSTTTSKERVSNHPLDVAARDYVKSLSGINYKSLYDFGTQNMEAFKKGAEWRAETTSSKEEMILFARYYFEKVLLESNISASEILEAWEKEFKSNG
jgi:hypothetical protein